MLRNFIRFVGLSVLIALNFMLISCIRPAGEIKDPWFAPSANDTPTPGGPIPTAVPIKPSTNNLAPILSGLTPTPDPPHPIPDLRTKPEEYVVQAGDTLGQIAQAYTANIEQIIELNKLSNPDILTIGQMLLIPPPDPNNRGPSFKIIPDSELIYSPGNANFDIDAFVLAQGGYLAKYLEEVNGDYLTGSQIVKKVALNYSVNPRILLSILEYMSGWVQDLNPPEKTLNFPIGIYDPRREGLYRQLAFAADNLNRGYYVWRVNGIAAWTLFDGAIVPVNPTINSGTAGVQYFFSRVVGLEDWNKAVTENGLITAFNELFGYPFQFTYEPIIPTALTQPAFQLPFEQGKIWSFTGGPHGAWDSGSAWGALDFAPPGNALGCVQNDEWVVAVADGYIVRANDGAVIQDFDGDQLEQTGWAILYMHIETRGRVQQGVIVKAGDRIGHPSCEGGISTGTHLHIARKYNGEWLPADQNETPFIMDGWVSTGTGIEYDGYLVRNSNSIEAINGRKPENEIKR